MQLLQGATVTKVEVDFADSKGQDRLFGPTFAAYFDVEDAPEDIKARMRRDENGQILTRLNPFSSFQADKSPKGEILFKFPDSYTSRNEPLPSLVIEGDMNQHQRFVSVDEFLTRKGRRVKFALPKDKDSFIHIPASAKWIILILHVVNDKTGCPGVLSERFELPAGRHYCPLNKLETGNSPFWESISFDVIPFPGRRGNNEANSITTVRFLHAHAKIDIATTIHKDLVKSPVGCIRPCLGYSYHCIGLGSGQGSDYDATQKVREFRELLSKSQV